MRTCLECGEENPGRARFCLACGAPLADAAAPREVRKRVTVLFCDLTGSTALGERLDPEAFRATQRAYFDRARSVLERHGGTVEKFIGDAVMAVFGVPRSYEDDALRAVRAAVELRAAVAELGLEARIGVNTGEVVAGEGDALVTGDAVNVGARLEQAAAPGDVLIGAETRQLVRDAVRVEPLELELKGKRAAVGAFRVVAVDPGAAGLLRRLDSPLVGRTRELQRLRDDFDQVVSQRSAQLFTLLGPPGVGKSRLVEEFVRATHERAAVVRGRCLHYGEGITYWPLVEVLLQLRVDPATILDLPSPADAAVATRKLLEARAAERPLVVVWDDIQWAEPTFLDLVEHLADWSRVAPILVLCVARPELLDVRPTWGGGKANATSLLLEPLAEAETSALIDNLLDGAGLADSTRGRILEAAGGNPLFVEEMLLMLQAGDGSDVAVPPTIHALLQARLDQLAADERAVIERGSIEGEVFHRLPVAELASERVRTSLDTHLAKLIRNELIRPEAATMPGDDAFRFRHLLIRDAAYDSLPKETRADLHERFAVWLEEHVDLVEQDEVVGYHLEQAVLYRRELGRDDEALGERAAERLAAAGRGAPARGDNRAAVRLLERAIALRSPAARLELLPDLVLGHLDLGRLADARRCIAELDAGDEHARVYASLLAPMIDHIGGTGSFQAAREEREKAVAAFERMSDHRGLALARLMQGHDEWTLCRAEAAAVRYREALAHAERAQRQSLVEEAVTNLTVNGLFGPRHVAEAEDEARALLARSSSFAVHTSAYRTLGRLAAIRGSFDEARELMRRGRERLADSGLVLHHAASSMAVAFIEEQAGDYETAAAMQQQGLDELTAFGEAAYASTVAANLAFSLVQLGRIDEADAALATARDLCPPEDVGTIVTAAIVDALLALHRGALAAAHGAALAAVEQADDTDFWQFRGAAREALAAILAALDRRAEAAAALEVAVEIYAAKGATVAETRAREVLTEL